MEDDDGNNMEDTSGDEKSVVQLARFGLEDLVTVSLPTAWGLVSAILGMVG